MEFSEKLRLLRAERNMTQEDLAAVAQVSRNAVSKWENGKGYPNWESLKRISREFGVTVDALIGEEELRCISLENHSAARKNGALLEGLFSFGLYLALGTLLPMLLFALDPTAPMAYAAVIGPVSFLLLGLLLGRLCRGAAAALLGAALAIGPIMIWYESAANMVAGLMELIFFVLFAGSFLFSFSRTEAKRTSSAGGSKANLPDTLRACLKNGWVWLCLVLAVGLTLAFSLFAEIRQQEPPHIWDGSVTCAQESTADSYIVTYSSEEIVSSTGTLTLQNPNGFPITVHLMSAGQKERVIKIDAGEMAYPEVPHDTVCTLGIHADVAEGTEIWLTVYDGRKLK